MCGLGSTEKDEIPIDPKYKLDDGKRTTVNAYGT